MTDGWLAKLRKERLPFAVLVVGLGLFLLAFLLGAPLLQHDPEGVADGDGLADDAPGRMVSDPQIPADFLPEKLRTPELPDPTERALDQQQDLSVKESENAEVIAPVLDGLRIDTVTLQTPQAVQVALALPDAPDRIAPGMISLKRFGERKGSSGTTGPRVGGGGFGDGPRCHPRRPGELRDPRNPIGGPLPLNGRAIVHRR
jgi:hypothetical protein